MNNTQTSRYIPIFLFLFFAGLYGLCMQGMPMRGDAEAMFLVARSLATDGDVSLDGTPSIPMVAGRGGEYYSKFGIGQSLVEAPFIWIANRVFPHNLSPSYTYSLQYFAATISVVLISAFCVLMLYRVATELSFSVAAATVLAFLFGLGSMIWPYSGYGFSEPLQTLCLLGALLAAMRAGHRARFMRWVVLSAVCAGFLGLTKPVMFVLGPLVVFYLWISIKSSSRPSSASIRGRHERPGMQSLHAVMVWTVVFGMFTAAALGYNWLRFGSMFQFGYIGTFDAGHGFGTPMTAGIYGFLFSPGKSIFLYTPLVIAGLAGARAFHREHPYESMFCWTATAAVLLLYGRWWAWHGDWCWGPRFLLPLIPLIMLPVATLLERFKTSGLLWKITFGLIASASILIQIPGTVINSSSFLYLATRSVPTQAFYIAGQNGLRDGQMATHFIPEFSPIVGQTWLLRVALSGHGPEQEALVGTPPWHNLLQTELAPLPSDLVRYAAAPDFWHVHYPRSFPGNTSWVMPVRNTLSAACLTTLLMLWFSVGCMKRKHINPGN